jgi:hypothetical protein
MLSGKKDQEEGLREINWTHSLIWFGICLLLLTILFI